MDAAAPAGDARAALHDPLARKFDPVIGTHTVVLSKRLRARIRPISRKDLTAIAAALPAAPYRTHADDLAWQHAGAVTELIAWLRSVPVGAGFIHWSGPRDASVAALFPTCPEIFRLEVVDRHRSKGIGAAIVRTLEALAGARGHALVGLGVGVSNHRAQLLYERLGYRAVVSARYMDRWTSPGPDGHPRVVEEPCLFMTKVLEPTAG